MRPFTACVKSMPSDSSSDRHSGTKNGEWAEGVTTRQALIVRGSAEGTRYILLPPAWRVLPVQPSKEALAVRWRMFGFGSMVTDLDIS